jgi:TonB-linked SusC/RagA family outer membrane protein
MRSSWTGLLAALACSSILAGNAVNAGAQQQPRAAITGRITESGTNNPLPDANIVIAGTQHGARSDARGQYRISDVSPGTYTIRVTRLGYAAANRQITIAGAENAVADFILQSAAVQIDQVVVTATGATERKRENGNDVGIIKPGDNVALAATPTLTSALQGKEAGLTITSSSGTPGAGSRIRIRGANSISLSNEPLLIVDGVRIDNNPNGSASFVGGQVVSRFDDINPEEIESVEVLKGPAASALYGTAAANGVLQITTKRGRSGRTSWRAYADYGQMWDPTRYPDNYYVMGTSLTTGALYSSSCTLDRRTLGLCRPDSTFTFNPISHYNVQGTGNQASYGISTSGGGDAAQYYISGDIQRAQGIVSPSRTHNVSLRANVTTQLRQNLTATFTSNYIDRGVAFPINDNNIYGVVPNGILGHAFNCTSGATGGTKTFCGADTLSQGFYSRNPSTFFFQKSQQIINRFIGGTNITWQPQSWLTALVVGGLDVDNGVDQSITPSNIVTDINSTLAQGSVTEYRRQIPTYSASGTLTARRSLGSTLSSNTSIGTQYINEQNHYEYAFGRNLVPGTGSLAGATAGAAVSDNNQTVITVGTYGNEQLAWRDRLFLTGGLRADRNSAFGSTVTWAYYPSASLSWVASEESFIRDHAPSWLDQLRLRAAYGQSGQRPAFRQAETYLNSAAVAQGSSESPAVVIGGTGNVGLSPEISVEGEGGLDASFFNNKVSAQYTYYHKITRDALIAAVLAPSLGVSSSQFVNLGRVLNAGHELTLNVTALDMRRGPRLDISFAASTNTNKLVDLGGQPAIFFNPQRHFQGYPLGAYFQQKYTYKDANNDHIISRSEITYGDTATASEFIGPVLPTRQLAITPTLKYRAIQIGALFDIRAGNYLYNDTEEFRCTSSAFSNCKSVSDSTASLDEQAAAVAKAANGTSYGYIQPAGFTKLRELSATINLPSRFASRANFSNVAFTIAGHNLKTWTKYKGYDPEVQGTSGTTANFTTVDFLTQPPLRTWTARLDFTF